MDEILRAVTISDFQNSPDRDQRSSCMPVVSEAVCFMEVNKPLLSEFGLKFERAEIHMIRWICGVSMKYRMTSEELRRLPFICPVSSYNSLAYVSLIG